MISSTDATEKLEDQRKTREAGNSLNSSKESPLFQEERAGDPKIPTTQKTNGIVFFFPFFVGSVAETVFYKKEANSRYEQRRKKHVESFNVTIVHPMSISCRTATFRETHHPTRSRSERALRVLRR